MRWPLASLALAFLGLAPSAQAAGLDASPTSLSFTQDVTDGPSVVRSAAVTNNTGSAALISVTPPSSSEFEVLTDDPFGDCSRRAGLFNGDSCQVRVRFDPSNLATITDSVVVSDGTNNATISLDGTGTFRQLTPSPPLAFGQQSIGAGPTAEQTATLMNSGTGPVTFTGAPVIAGSDANQFQVASSDCTGTLQPNAPCTVHVTFDPSSAGDKSAQVTVPSNAPAVHVDLTGTGILAQLAGSPDTLGFTADVNAGPSAPQAATITNVGSEPVPIGSVVISDPVGFTQVTGAANDCTPGMTLAIGGTCDVRIAFDPFSRGPKSASVTVNSSAPPISVALNGLATVTALDVPGTLDFGTLKVGAGKTAIGTSTVTNTGTEPITLAAIRLKDPDTARFLWAGGLAGDCAPGRTLTGGETCELRIVFVPQSDGTKTGTMTVGSTAGVRTLLLTAAGTPGLSIPAFRERASRTQNRRLTIDVNPIGGIVWNIVVRVRSSSGAVVGTGTLTRASSERSVTVRLRSALKAGRYVASASGRDSFAGVVTAKSRGFSLR